MSLETLLGFLRRLWRPDPPPLPPTYLEFLNLLDDEASRHYAAELMEQNQARGTALDATLAAWLTERDWRPHLVAAVSLVLSGTSPARRKMLWGAIDRHSWVSPQLVAAAALIDPEFETQAQKRIETCRQIPLPKNSPTADWNQVTTNPKRLAALVALCSRSGRPAWLAACMAERRVSERLARDVDRGGEIALRWLTAIQGVAAAVTAKTEKP